jgi:hypothetical protein
VRLGGGLGGGHGGRHGGGLGGGLGVRLGGGLGVSRDAYGVAAASALAVITATCCSTPVGLDWNAPYGPKVLL